MSKRDKGTLKETPQERAAAELALARYADYKQRWLPIQQQAARVIENFARPDSFERERAGSRATGAVGGAYDQAAGQIENKLRSRGVDAGSSNFRMADADVQTERAKASGIAGAATRDAIDDAYIEGLSGLMAVGRNQSSQAIEGINRSADIAGANARAGAAAGAARRAGNIQLGTTVAGMAGGYFAPDISAAAKKWMQGPSGFGFDSGVEHVPGVDT